MTTRSRLEAALRGLEPLLRGDETVDGRVKTAMGGVVTIERGLEIGVGGDGAASVRLEAADRGDEGGDSDAETGEADGMTTVDGLSAGRARLDRGIRGSEASG